MRPVCPSRRFRRMPGFSGNARPALRLSTRSGQAWAGLFRPMPLVTFAPAFKPITRSPKLALDEPKNAQSKLWTPRMRLNLMAVTLQRGERLPRRSSTPKPAAGRSRWIPTLECGNQKRVMACRPNIRPQKAWTNLWITLWISARGLHGPGLCAALSSS
jgi:hypothetical protein